MLCAKVQQSQWFTESKSQMVGPFAEIGLLVCALAAAVSLGWVAGARRARREVVVGWQAPTPAAPEEAPIAKAPVDRASLTILANMSHELRTPLNGVLAIA